MVVLCGQACALPFPKLGSTLTCPMPLSIEAVCTLVVTKESVEHWPGDRLAGEAVKLVMAVGRAVTEIASKKEAAPAGAFPRSSATEAVLEPLGAR